MRIGTKTWDEVEKTLTEKLASAKCKFVTGPFRYLLNIPLLEIQTILFRRRSPQKHRT